MDSISDDSLAKARDVVLHSEPHFVYFFLSTYQHALYWSWVKDLNKRELIHEFDKRRQALEEKLSQFYPSNINDDHCHALRQIAKMCASQVARELKVTISSSEKASPSKDTKQGGQPVSTNENQSKQVLVSQVRVAIDSIRADVKLCSPNSVGEVKFRTVPKQNSSDQFLLSIWLYDAAGNRIGNEPHVTVQEMQISGVNGFTMVIPEPAESALRNILSMRVFWEIAPVQEHFPLVSLYWLQKIPLIMAHIGGQLEESNGRSASYWRVFEPLFRACVGDWQQWPQCPGLAREVMCSLIKLYFLVPEKTQCELAIQVLVRFCQETAQPNASENHATIKRITEEAEFVRLVAENLTLYHHKLTGSGRIKVINWLTIYLTGRDIRVLFTLLKYCDQMYKAYGRNHCDRAQLDAIADLNSVIQEQVKQLDHDQTIEGIIQAYTNHEGRVRNDQGEMRKIRGTKRRNGRPLNQGAFWMEPGVSPNGIVRRISHYLTGLSEELQTKCNKRAARLHTHFG